MANEVQLWKDSQLSLINISDRVAEVQNGIAKLSLYDDEIMSMEVWEEGIKKLKKSFPRLEDNWYDELTIRLKELKFTNKRFMDAVKRVQDDYKYPEPALAEIIRHDKQVNLITWTELERATKEFGPTLRTHYIAVDIQGKPMYVLRRDMEVYNLDLKPWVAPKPKEVKRTGMYKDGEKVEKLENFSLTKHFNKIVKETGIGTEIKKGESDDRRNKRRS